MKILLGIDVFVGNTSVMNDDVATSAKSGVLPTSGQLTVTTVSSTTMDSLCQYEVELDNLRSNSIHAPPGPCPLRAGAHPLTKSQVTAERKAAKELKAKALEERKIAAAARRATAAAKKQAKQDTLVASAKAKAAKAVAKAEGLRVTASGHHLTKKTKGDSDGFTLVADERGVPKQSPPGHNQQEHQSPLSSSLSYPPASLGGGKESRG